MENSARIRVNLSTKELEIEGSEQFVKEYADKIENLLSALVSSKSPTPAPLPKTENSSSDVTANTDLPATFGEYLHTFPSNITDVDRILIAGFYVQSQSAENSFITASANELLKEQGIKLGNAADAVTKNKNAKKVFALAKGKFRVSQTGITHISSLISKK